MFRRAEGREDGLVNRPIVAERLRVSPQWVREREGEPGFPRPAGNLGDGRSPVWSWQSVERWAKAVGKLTPEGRPVRRLEGPPTLPEMLLVKDEIVSYRGRSRVDGRAHVRIYRGPQWRRPMVLVGQLDDNPGTSVSNAMETVAATIATRFFGETGAFDLYEYTDDEYEPDVFFDRHVRPGRVRAITFDGVHATSAGPVFEGPHWNSISIEEFTELLGGARWQVYPGEFYTERNVREFRTNGSRPFAQEWDPHGLRRKIEQLRLLVRHGAAMEGAATSGADSVSGALSKARAVLADEARFIAEQYGRFAGFERPADWPEQLELAVHLEPFHPTSDQTGLISQTYADGLSADNPAEAVRAVRAARVACGAVELQEPWRVADEILTGWAHAVDPDFRAIDHPPTRPSFPIEAATEADRRYLATVEWLSPSNLSAEEQRRAVALEDQLRADQRPARWGFDPFNRMVVMCDDGEHFVVEWPLNPPAQPYPDHAMLLDGGAPGARPVYVAYGEVVDLLPGDPNGSDMMPPFEWGYGGTGPLNLREAVARTIGEDFRLPSVEASFRSRGALAEQEYRKFTDWARSKIDQLPRDRRWTWSVGEIREHYGPVLAESHRVSWWAAEGRD